MRKLLLITTALVGLSCSPAQAAPLTVTWALIQNGVAWGSAISASFGAVGTALLRIGGSVLFNAAASALTRKKSTSAEITQGLQNPTELPPYRFVYGTRGTPGTPVGWNVVGRILYVCYLLNSRPSSMASFELRLDDRPVEYTGNPFDFAGPGATAVNSPFDGWARFWIGRGDQTGAPFVISEESGFFEATDAWRGRTVLWCRYDCGPDDSMTTRWPTAPTSPPAVVVVSDYSILYDPRTGTSGHSRNQALAVLDALRENPLRPYDDRHLWLETFAWAADVADQTVTNRVGTSPRYCCDGILVFSDAELEDQLEPLLAAGGARFIRVGGRLGIVPAIARNPVMTISDFTDDGAAEFSRHRADDELYTECVATYVAPDRNWESAEAPVYVVPGAQDEDGGAPKRLGLDLQFVTDHRQAQRLAKIAAMRSRMQRTIRHGAFPDAVKLVAGSVCTAAYPWPYDGWNGKYEVELIGLSAGLNDDRSVTMRPQIGLRETSDAIYSWDAEVEEQDVDTLSFDYVAQVTQPPASVAVESGSGAALISGGQVTPRVVIDWDESSSTSALSYDWQYQVDGGAWISGGSVDASAVLRAWIAPAVIGSSYKARVRTVGLYGRSAWVESAAVTASAPDTLLATPEIVSAVGGAAQVTLTLRQADDAAATLLELWHAEIDDVDSADLLATVSAGANVLTGYTHSGLGSAEVHYYWLRARNGLGQASAYTDSATATTT